MKRPPGPREQADTRDRPGESGADTSGATPDPAPDADADRFAEAMADVVRLPPDRRERVPVAPPVPYVTTPRAVVPSSPSAPVDDPDDRADAGFVAPGVDRRELRKLKRGEYTAAGRLDLHGMIAADAVASVKRFIDNSRHRRHRCVCIVHGRGLHSEGNVAILKARVRECLRQHRAVLAFADAPRTDGGAGAVYVLLRR